MAGHKCVYFYIIYIQMMVDWHIQGREVGTKPGILVAVMSATDDVSGTWQSPYDHCTSSHVDHTPSLDHTVAVARQHESERQRRLSAATVETFVSFCCGEGLAHSLTQLGCP